MVCVIYYVDFASMFCSTTLWHTEYATRALVTPVFGNGFSAIAYFSSVEKNTIFGISELIILLMTHLKPLLYLSIYSPLNFHGQHFCKITLHGTCVRANF